MDKKIFVKKIKMTTSCAFEEIIDFITSMPRNEEIWAYKPSMAAQSRLEDLLKKEKHPSYSRRKSRN